jgi:hypothetical protein
METPGNTKGKVLRKALEVLVHPRRGIWLRITYRDCTTVARLQGYKMTLLVNAQS